MNEKKKFKYLNTSIGNTAFVFSFTLVFSTKFANVCLLLFCFLGLICYIIKGDLKFKIEKLSILKFSVLLLLFSTILSLFFFQNFENAIKALGRRSTFFFMPLIFLLFDKKTLNKIKKKSLKGILLGSILSSVFLISNIFFEYYLTRPIFSISKEIFNFYHTSTYFTRMIDIHPSYYGMYLLLALTYLYFRKKKKNIIYNGFSFFVLTTSIIFLSSRIIILLYILLSVFFVIYILYIKNRNVYKTVISFSLIFIISMSIIFMFKKTYIYQRIVKQSAWELSYEIGTNYNYKGNGDSRLARWDAATQVVKERPLFGYGVFNEQKVLVKQYIKMKMFNAAKSNYNSHNQYLGFFIEGGVLSMLTLLIYLFYNLFFSIRSKDIISVFFFTSVIFICLVENYLIRNAGVIYISFFGTLFLYKNKYND